MFLVSKSYALWFAVTYHSDVDYVFFSSILGSSFRSYGQARLVIFHINNLGQKKKSQGMFPVAQYKMLLVICPYSDYALLLRIS